MPIKDSMMITTVEREMLKQIRLQKTNPQKATYKISIRIDSDQSPCPIRSSPLPRSHFLQPDYISHFFHSRQLSQRPFLSVCVCLRLFFLKYFSYLISPEDAVIDYQDEKDV